MYIISIESTHHILISDVFPTRRSMYGVFKLQQLECSNMFKLQKLENQERLHKGKNGTFCSSNPEFGMIHLCQSLDRLTD